MISQVTATCHDSLPVDKNIIWNSVDSELRPYCFNLILIEPIMESTDVRYDFIIIFQRRSVVGYIDPHDIRARIFHRSIITTFPL